MTAPTPSSPTVAEARERLLAAVFEHHPEAPSYESVVASLDALIAAVERATVAKYDARYARSVQRGREYRKQIRSLQKSLAQWTAIATLAVRRAADERDRLAALRGLAP